MSVAEQKSTGAKMIGATRVRKPRPVFYPDGDGKPMAETIEHRDAMMYAIQAAEECLADVAEVWVSGNDFVYYVQGDPRKRVSPDCYVVLDVPRYDRRMFKVWEDNDQTPNLVIEFTSRGTAREDRETKFDLYQDVLKVEEYVMFDPLSQYLRPRLQGYRLTAGVYQPVPLTSEGHFVSEQTGIRLFADGILLRFIHPKTGQVVLTRREAREAIRRETQRAETEASRADAEAQRAIAAEAENERLRAELEKLRRQNP